MRTLIALLFAVTLACAVDDALVARALDPDAAVALAARGQLRALGTAAFSELLHRCEHGGRPPADWDVALDEIAQQRGSRHSGLYWYTDLAAARRSAVESGKPILSLRLLGKLTDERCCANSRLFRSILYANAEVSEFLRSRVVLHWSSERPVPQVTIDFGDGRRIETTVAGNSVHYLLDGEGTPLDAIPGLLCPGAFLDQLREDLALHRVWTTTPAERRVEFLRGHHRARLAATRDELLETGGDAVAEMPMAVHAAFPPIAASESLTYAKMLAEAPVLKAIRLWKQAANADALTAWAEKMAGMHPEFGQLDAASESLIRARLRPDADPGSALADLRSSLARDTVLDRYVLHTLVHREFADAAPLGFEALNRWIYDRLFLTPAQDPWLGLLPAGYDGMDRNGAVVVGATR
jgi:hypothetical protein